LTYVLQRRVENIRREASPLLDSPYAGAIIWEFCRADSSKAQSYWGCLRGRLLHKFGALGTLRELFLKTFISLGSLRGALAPLHKNIPLPLIKGKGIQGIGLLYNLPTLRPTEHLKASFEMGKMTLFSLGG